ncbi:MAG: sensor histidine kinase [Bacteroidota bacterium]|jgi:two-component system phosphate regulon sensor histidine kinase PhoR
MSRILHLALISLLFSLIFLLIIYFSFVFLKLDFNLNHFLIFFTVALLTSFFTFFLSYELSVFRRVRNISERINGLIGIKESEPQTLVNIPEEKKDPLEELNECINQLEESRRAEIEKLLKLENHRREFLGNVSHELKTPIFNIQGYVSTLIDGGLYDESINLEYLKRADKSVDRMIHIIDDLEQISQLESGILELDYEYYDITEQIKDVFISLEIQAQSKNISFGFLEQNVSSIKVFADKFRIRQVLVNLITNSIKYGKHGGKTLVGLLEKDNEVSVFVSDDGIGIEEIHLPRLFERFYRVDKGRSREQGGTGLGLAIVKHILEAHHQGIRVTSKVGEGTTFTFNLQK